MRIGIFGGTFDPIHVGHLILAEQCREQAQLDQVLFIPAARPPHKVDRPLTPFHHRVEMLTLTLAGQPSFQVDELEKDRPGPSYTVETLELIRSRDPGAELFLMLGADCLPDLPAWYQPTRILEQAGLLIVPRPGWVVQSSDAIRKAVGLSADWPLRYQVVGAPLIEIASRDLRRRVVEGRSIRYQVPRAVECYIEHHRLYSGS
jgi:nicotinate-nucleotide adenylyltransferase